jgi:predicted nucleic acid-binding protein
VSARYLIDTSGLVRILHSGARDLWRDHMAAGVIAICPVVELEFLYSARSLSDRLNKQKLLREVFPWVPMSDQAYERAAAMQQALTDAGLHRSAGVVDLLLAATAERARLVVLTADRDFQTIAGVTGQPIRMVTA